MPPPSGLTCAIGGHPLYGKQRLIRHHPRLDRYFSEWVPEFAEHYPQFREEDTTRICYNHHEQAHQMLQPILTEWWSLPDCEKTAESALSFASACSAVFWRWLAANSSRTDRGLE